MNKQFCVFIVDDDDDVREALSLAVETAELSCQAFASAELFLQAYQANLPGCLLLDIKMPGMSGFELQAELIRRHIDLPIIFLTAHGDIPMSVRAIKEGAVDFLTKPVSTSLLLDRINSIKQLAIQKHQQTIAVEAINLRLNRLSARELEILPLLLMGHSNKEIARRLGISYRTMEIHRAQILKKTGAINLLELKRLCEDYHFPDVSKP